MGGGAVVAPPPQQPPFVKFYSQDGRSDLKNVFTGKCPKDEATAKHLVCKKALPIPEKN